MPDQDKFTFMWQRLGFWINLLGTPMFLVAAFIISGQISELKETKSQVRSKLMCVYHDGSVSECDFNSLRGNEGPIHKFIAIRRDKIVKALFSNAQDYLGVKTETSDLYGLFRENSNGMKEYRKLATEVQQKALTLSTQFTLDQSFTPTIKFLKDRNWGTRIKGVVTTNDAVAKKNTSKRVTIDLIFSEPTADEEKEDEKRILIITDMRVLHEK